MQNSFNPRVNLHKNQELAQSYGKHFFCNASKIKLASKTMPKCLKLINCMKIMNYKTNKWNEKMTEHKRYETFILYIISV